MRHLLSIADLSPQELSQLVDRTIDFKEGKVGEKALREKCIALIFQKPSTRTRVSFEVAINELGGHPISLGWSELQLGRGETIADTARVLSKYVHAVIMRLYKHTELLEFAKHSSVPVINALTDLEHPCQVIADLATLKQHFGKLEGLRLTWVGDGNNVCNSLCLACALLGLELVLSIPEGYDPPLLDKAREMGGKVEVRREPSEAVLDCDVIYTDVFVSMGQETQAEQRMRVFYPKYQVNRQLLEKTKTNSVVLHCQPWRIGQEITADVAYSERCLAFQQAENRLHSAKSVLEFCLLR